MKNKTLIGVIIVAIFIGGYFFFQNFLTTTSVTNTTQEQQLQVETSTKEITNSEVDQLSDLNIRFCDTNDDCGLLICSGCFSKDFLKTAPPDDPCRQYEDCRCECIENKCIEVE